MASTRWKNFRMWRGRLPHWRADDVAYYVTFRHRRPLDETERDLLFRALLQPDGRAWYLLIVCVLPEQTDLIGSLAEDASQSTDRLTQLVERGKTRAGKAIMKATAERFPPFYTESYDRILRDESEQAAYFDQIVRAPVEAGLADSPEGFATLWVADRRPAPPPF